MQYSSSYGGSQVSLSVQFFWEFYYPFHISYPDIWFIFLFLLSLIDDGKNPDEFTRDVINSCIAKNQITKGKTDAFKVTFFQLILCI